MSIAEEDDNDFGVWRGTPEYFEQEPQANAIRIASVGLTKALSQLFYDRGELTESDRLNLSAQVEQYNADLITLGVQAHAHEDDTLEERKPIPAVEAIYIAGQILNVLRQAGIMRASSLRYYGAEMAEYIDQQVNALRMNGTPPEQFSKLIALEGIITWAAWRFHCDLDETSFDDLPHVPPQKDI